MEIADRVLCLYLHEKSEVYQVEQAQHLLQRLASKGFAVITEEESAAIWPLWHAWTGTNIQGEHIPPPAPLAASVSAFALSALERFCRSRQKIFRVRGFSITPVTAQKSGKRLFPGCEWSLFLAEEEGVVGLSYLRKHFTALQSAEKAYERWVGMIQLVYHICHPVYGFSTTGEEKAVSREEILAHQIAYLYEINLFGPEIVERLGRERVESAPAQIVTKLDDGGIMVVPSENLLPGFSQYRLQQVAEQLGLAIP